MSKRKVPETSRLAHDSVKEHKAAIYAKIITALEEMKVGGTSEEIAAHLRLDDSIVWKRMGELEKAGIVFNLENVTRKTKKGRKAMIRQLVKLKSVGIQQDLF